MGSSSRLQIGLLGPFELGVDGRAVDLTSDRLRAILAALASSAGAPVSIDALGEYVWGAEW
jgi:DNA-binding SARP family transcriptional activator